MKPQSMFATGEDLPLFSGSPIRVQDQPFLETENPGKHLGFFVCPACRDTGQVTLQSGKTVRCWCQGDPDPDDPDGPLYFQPIAE